MKFPFRTKFNGVYYPANTEIPCDKAEKQVEEKIETVAVEETVVEEKAEKPKRVTKKK